jgi:hypothetical protein
MNKFILPHKVSAFFCTTMAWATVLLAQNASPSAAPLREVRDRTIISKEFPEAELNFGKDFRYIGGQHVDLYGNADAEQHLFVKAGDSGTVERFYMVQFEHFFPTNKYTYDYPASRKMDIGGLQFIYDVKSWPDYAAMQIEDPASDGAAYSRLLAQHNLALPKKTARVRMVYLPTLDRRIELMVIYGEALPENSAVPVREGGVVLDEESPDSARMLLEDARRDFKLLRK